MKKENPGGFSFFIGTELRIRVKRGKVKRRHKKIFAGAVYHSDTVASRLRRVNRICSSRVGENCVEVEKWAHTVRPYGRKNPLPFPIFEAVAGLWSAPDYQIKGNWSPKRIVLI